MFGVRFQSKLALSARISLFVLLVIAVTFSFQIRFARAAPLTIDITPASAPVGETMTISGADATASGEVKILIDGYVFLTGTVANESGGYSVDLMAPAVPLGSFWIMALDVNTGDTAWATFSVEPRILLTPSEGGYDQEVTVKGDGFNADSDVTLTFDGMDVSPWPLPSTDFMGSFTASFYVPSQPNGTYTFTVDDEWGGTASALFNVVPNLILWPASGASLTVAYVEGYGFTPDFNVTVYFGSVDVTPYPYMTTWIDGSFGMPFFVPSLPDGVYTIQATDDSGLSASVTFAVPGPILTLTPDRVSASAVVTARGIGFPSRAPVLLYLEDITMTSLIDLMWMSPSLMAANDGSFAYSFIVPVTNPGVYTVGAYMMPGSPPAQPVKLTSTSLIIVDDSPLDVVVNVGSLHFRGEIAEFYVETSFGGKPVDATIDSARLYMNGTLKQDLTSIVGHATTGLYRIPYSVASDAALGSYNLIVEASYETSLIEAFGTSSSSFLLSRGFTDQNAKLIDVQGKIGTIIVPDLGIIKANLTEIHAKLISLDGNEATIQSDLGALKASADAINAKVESIEGNVATISSDLGTVKAQIPMDPPDYQEIATMILALVAAAGAILSLLYVRKIKPSTSPPTFSQPPATPPPDTSQPATAATEPPSAEAPVIESPVTSPELETRENAETQSTTQASIETQTEASTETSTPQDN